MIRAGDDCYGGWLPWNRECPRTPVCQHIVSFNVLGFFGALHQPALPPFGLISTWIQVNYCGKSVDQIASSDFFCSGFFRGERADTTMSGNAKTDAAAADATVAVVDYAIKNPDKALAAAKAAHELHGIVQEAKAGGSTDSSKHSNMDATSGSAAERSSENKGDTVAIDGINKSTEVIEDNCGSCGKKCGGCKRSFDEKVRATLKQAAQSPQSVIRYIALWVILTMCICSDLLDHAQSLQADAPCLQRVRCNPDHHLCGPRVGDPNTAPLQQP